jgi:undecaprenyl-diphosphatase
MAIIEALVLGIVQGLTEFLPISSSAHLVLVPELLGWEQPSLPYVVLLHAGTLLALVVYFRRELAALATGVFRPGPERKLAMILALGTLPAAVIGVAFEEQFEEAFGHPSEVAVQLVVSGLILVAAEALSRRSEKREDPRTDAAGTEQMARRLTWRSALGVGFAQAFAIVPGISRSGATIAAGLLAGLSRPLAARFSFLLSIPILFGTSVFEVPKLSGSRPGSAALIVGFVASTISGYAAIAGLIAFLQRRGLLPFAAYCVVVGAVLASVL